MIARPMTWPVDAPRDCVTRHATRVAVVLAKKANGLATLAKARPVSTPGRRPKRSDNGPNSSCATASPVRYSDTVSWTLLGSVANRATMLGSAGTRMLSDSELTPVIALSNVSNRHGVRRLTGRSRFAGAVAKAGCRLRDDRADGLPAPARLPAGCAERALEFALHAHDIDQATCVLRGRAFRPLRGAGRLVAA